MTAKGCAKSTILRGPGTAAAVARGGRSDEFPVVEQFDPGAVGRDGAIGAGLGDIDCDIAGMADAFGCAARRRDRADMIGRV